MKLWHRTDEVQLLAEVSSGTDGKTTTDQLITGLGKSLS